MGTFSAVARSAASLLLGSAMVVGAAGVAQAHSDSGTARFDNGQRITANMWIQNFSWTSCGKFQSSAVMARKPKYITDRTDFYQIGLGGLSVKGLNIGSSRQDSNTIKWTNSNGAKGSYLSGSVCGGWGAVYVGADVAGGAFYYGNYRVASAHV